MARQQQARVTGVAAEALTRGPFSSLPTYFQQDVAAGLGRFVAEVLLKHVQTVVQVDTQYYTSFRGSGKGNPLDRTFLGNLPRFSPPSWEEVQRAARIGLSGSWISQGFHLMLGLAGVTVQDVVHFAAPGVGD